MNHLSKTLFQSFVKPFYKENAGAFVFVFTMMFCIISKVDGAGLYEYHYSLVTAILTNNAFLLLVLFIWLLYVRKYAAFVSAVIISPHYSFLQIYNQLHKTKQFLLLLVVEFWLLLPVLLYVLFIVFVGVKQHLYLPVVLIVSYLLMLSLAAATWHVYQLNNPNKRMIFPSLQWGKKLSVSSSYPFALIEFIARNQPLIWMGIKVFTCGVLYLIARNNTLANYDVSMSFLFYNFGILANGVLLFRIREFEEIYLHFYRGLPVSLIQKLLQYALVCFSLLIPELITIIMLVPGHLHFADGANFILCGIGLLLLMNSITFIYDFTMKDYIKILLAVFFLECIVLITVGFVFLYLFLFSMAVYLFLKWYYQFEQNLQ